MKNHSNQKSLVHLLACRAHNFASLVREAHATSTHDPGQIGKISLLGPERGRCERAFFSRDQRSLCHSTF
jgi:hypothetical protein